MNGVPVARHDHTKHLGLYLDSALNFSKHVKEAVLVALKGISLLNYLSKYVNRNVLNLYDKLHVRPHQDYGNVIYHNQRADLMQLIEQVQYKATLIVSGCWQGTSWERLYDELGWESLSDRRWARRMTTFYKIIYELAPSYLSDHLPEQSVNITTPFSRIEMYDISFFPPHTFPLLHTQLLVLLSHHCKLYLWFLCILSVESGVCHWHTARPFKGSLLMTFSLELFNL